MSPILILIAKLLVGLVLFCAWVYLTLHPQPNQDAIVSFIQMTLGGMVVHLTSGQATANLPTPQVQVIAHAAPSSTQPEEQK